MELEEIRCKNCDAPLDMTQAKERVVKCTFCRSVFTLPKPNQTDEVLSLLLIGNNELDCCAFDRAYTAFAKAAELDETEPEALFGMALAKHRVQYLRDEVNNRLQPICHEISGRVFSKDKNFRKALEPATDAQRAEYERRAGEIDYIRQQFYALKKAGRTYDCFLCVKESGDDEKKTVTDDAVFVKGLYNRLVKKGIRPFYSDFDLCEQSGAAYEAHILYALHTAKCMLVVCSDEDYLQTKWVKNEYARYTALMRSGEKPAESLTIVFNGTPIEKLPGNECRIQGIDRGKSDGTEKIGAFIAKFAGKTHVAAPKPPEPQKPAPAEKIEKVKKAKPALPALAENARRAYRREKKYTVVAYLSFAVMAAACFATLYVPTRPEFIFPPMLALWIVSIVVFAGVGLVFFLILLDELRCEWLFGVATVCMTVSIMVAIPINAVIYSDRADYRENFDGYASGFYYVVNDDETVTVSTTAFSEKKMIVPDKINGKTVTAISRSLSWSVRDTLVEVCFPDSILRIEDSAFSGCEKLGSIKVGDNVEYIGYNAFAETAFYNSKGNWTEKGLLYLSSSNKTHYLLEAKPGITGTVTLKDNTRHIGYGAFGGCAKLESVKLNEGIETVGARAFRDCTSLKEIVIPQSVRGMGKGVFDGCENLTVYCRAASEPAGWSADWNLAERPVVWGFTDETAA